MGGKKILIQEAENCESKLGKPIEKNMTDDNAHLIFSRLILQGKIHEAICVHIL